MTPRAKKRLIAAVVVVLLAGGLGSAFVVRAAMRERTLDRALHEGMAAYSAGDYAGGMQHLSIYVGRIKTNADAIVALAECRRRIPQENRKHLFSALAFARAAAQTDPQNLKALELVLELCDNLGFGTETIDAAAKILAIDQRHPEALMARTRALARTGRHAEALESARQAATLRPDTLEFHDAVVQLMQMREQDPKVIRQYAAEAIAGRDNDVDFALFECRVALATRDLEAARTAARRAAGLPVSTPAQLASLIRHLSLLQLQQETQQVLAAARTNPDLAAEAVLIQVERQWKNGLLETAAAELAAHPAPASPSEREIALRTIIVDGANAEEAIARLQSLSSADAEYWTAVLRGRQFLIKGDLQQGTTELARAADLGPSHGFAQYFLARAYVSAGDWRRAVRSYESAVQADPAWRGARFELVNLLLDNGRLTEARDHAAAALSIQRSLPEAILYGRTSVALMETGSLPSPAIADALRAIDLLREQQPQNPALLSLYARGLVAAGRVPEGKEFAERVLALEEPPSLELGLPLCNAVRPHDPTLAARLESMIIGDRLSSANLASYRASTFAAQGELQQARQTLVDAIAAASGPDKLRLQLSLAGLLDRMDDPAAKDQFVALSEAHPRDTSVQLALLNSGAAWSDQAAIAPALARLANLVGEDSAQWKMHESRRLLTFAPTPETAARVVAMLASLLQDDPTNTRAAQLQAQAYLQLDDRNRAIEVLSRTAAAAPTEAAIYPQLIDLLHQAGRPQDAAQRLSAFVALRNLPLPLQRQRAQLLMRQGMRTEYTRELRDLAVRGDDQDRLNLAMERAMAGDAAEAGPLFEQLLAAREPSLSAVLAASDFFTGRDGLAAGLRTLERLPADTDPYDVARYKALLCLRSGDAAQAEQLLRHRTESAKPSAWAELAQFYFERNRLPEAEDAVQRGLAIAPKEPQLLWLSGVIKIRSGSGEAGALDQLTAAAASDQSSPEIADLVQAFRDFGEDSNEDRLVSRLQAITRKYPTSYQAWRQLVNVLAMRGAIDQAATAAFTATQHLPADPRAAQLAAEALAASGRAADSRTMARRWRELAPTQASQADLFLARLAIGEAQFEEAARLLAPWQSTIVSRAEQAPADLQVLAIALVGAGRAEDAFQVLGGRSSDTAWQLSAVRIGESCAAKADRARAWLRSLEPFNEPTPELLMAAAQAWYRVAMTSSMPEDRVQAIRWAQQAAQADPFRGSASAILAAMHHRAGAIPEAIASYRVAVEHMPESAVLINNLAYLLASSASETAPEAASLARKAVDLSAAQRMPDSARKNFLETLGFAELRAGRPQEAEKAFEAGLRMDASAPDLLIGLLEARIALNKAAEAKATLDRIENQTALVRSLSPELSKRLADAKASLAALR